MNKVPEDAKSILVSGKCRSRDSGSSEERERAFMAGVGHLAVVT